MRAWFESTFAAPTAVQSAGWPAIARGQHVLLLAPTGAGKTLAALLWCIDALGRQPVAERRGGVRVLYLSPLEALAYDIERNLRAPLAGVAEQARRLAVARTEPRVAIRSGDTPQRDRRRQARDPAEILVTTPESLYLILTSAARETLRSVRCVIVDEVHALAPTKRGAHLALSLERLSLLTGADPQRIGLSATARPAATVARFLGGDRPVSIVDRGAPPALDLEVLVPMADMVRPNLQPAPSPRRRRKRDARRAGLPTRPDAAAVAPGYGVWPRIVPELLRLIRSHESTIVFVPSRGLCEQLVRRLVEAAGEPLVRAHHGSLSQEHRREVEGLLGRGQIAAIVATSSLELGIDMGVVDLVVHVGSPGAVARGLQRVGRAGHGVGQVSCGRLVPKHRGDLLETAAVARGMLRGDIEALRLPHCPLDVLTQQLVAMCVAAPRQLERQV